MPYLGRGIYRHIFSTTNHIKSLSCVSKSRSQIVRVKNMSKFVIISLLAVLAVVNARGLYTEMDNVNKNEIAPLQKEGRIVDLLAFPALGVVILKSLKAAWFVLSTICSVVDFKLAALAVAVKAGSWLLSFKLPVLMGAALIFGFCKVSGLCGLKSIFAVDKPDDLDYASDYLDKGMRKFGKSS